MIRKINKIKRLLAAFLGIFFLFLGSSFKTASISTEFKKNVFYVKTIDLGAIGDATFIKYNDVEILIDCGGTKDSEKNIKAALDDCKDNQIDMVILTHGDSDHITNFSRIFNPLTTKYSIDTLIDFDVTQDSTIKKENFNDIDLMYKSGADEQGEEFTSTYSKYAKTRDNLIKKRNKKGNKGINHYYTASQCTYKKRKVKNSDIEKDRDKKLITNKFIEDDIRDIFVFNKGNTSLTVKILYNYYYDHGIKNENKPTNVIYNLISVCTLVTYKNGNDSYDFLFTGDLEEFKSVETSEKTNNIDSELKSYARVNGESLLVQNNKELKNGVFYFNAGHHGSQTSNSLNLLNVIKPKYVVMSSVFTTFNNKDKFKFPHQAALNNFLRFTDKIYITDKKSDTVTKYCGTILFYFDFNDKKMKVQTETNEYNSLLKSNFFIKNRYVTGYLKNINGASNVNKNPIDLSYMKCGSIDVVINYGINADLLNAPSYDLKIKELCNDGVIDAFIITDYKNCSMRYLKSANFYNFLLKNKILIKNLFIPNNYGEQKYIDNASELNKMIQTYSNGNKKVIEKVTIIEKDSLYVYDFDKDDFVTSTIDNEGVKLNFKFSNYAVGSMVSSLALKTTIFGVNYLNLGNIEEISPQVSLDEDFLKNIDAFQIPNFGYVSTSDEWKKVLNIINNFKTRSIFILNSIYGTMSGEKMKWPSAFYTNDSIIMNRLYATSISKNNFISYAEDKEIYIVITNMVSKNRSNRISVRKDDLKSKSLSQSYSKDYPTKTYI